jgi:hypothetical protein
VPDGEPPAEQLRLNLAENPKPANTSDRSTVVAFVDAGTLAVRRDAIERVKARGIFQAPEFKKR